MKVTWGLLCGEGRGGQNRGPGPGGWWVLLQGQADRNWTRYQRGSAEFRSGHVTFKALVKPSRLSRKWMALWVELFSHKY